MSQTCSFVRYLVDTNPNSQSSYRKVQCSEPAEWCSLAGTLRCERHAPPERIRGDGYWRRLEVVR